MLELIQNNPKTTMVLVGLAMTAIGIAVAQTKGKTDDKAHSITKKILDAITGKNRKK